MKKFVLFVLLIMFGACSVLAASEELSKQATAFYSDNNNTKAIDLILQIKENERTAQDWLLMGNILADSGQMENAIFMYKKAIATDKDCYKAYYNLANYYAEKGMNNLAIQNYKKAASIKYDNAYIFYNLACVYINMEDYRNARTNLHKAITIKSDVPEFHYNLAYVYKKQNNKKMAQTYLYNYNELVKQE